MVTSITQASIFLQESGTTNSGLPGRTCLWDNGSGCLQESRCFQTIQTGSLENPTMLETSAAWSFMRRITMATCGTIGTELLKKARPLPRRLLDTALVLGFLVGVMGKGLAHKQQIRSI
ncbi:hypothetical protein J6590_100981 [Homalodisca vitripennis]|nr:hypothetical protein J6590_100981 [Homalodisca vitripennis]